MTLSESLKILSLPRTEVHARISSLLSPFLVSDSEFEGTSVACKLVPESFDFEQEECFEGELVGNGDTIGHSGLLESTEVRSGRTGLANNSISSKFITDTPIDLNLETKCVIIFIPPKYHLALRFTISENTTLCRIRTDRFNLLSYMDSFFWADFLKNH